MKLHASFFCDNFILLIALALEALQVCFHFCLIFIIKHSCLIARHLESYFNISNIIDWMSGFLLNVWVTRNNFLLFNYGEKNVFAIIVELC